MKRKEIIQTLETILEWPERTMYNVELLADIIENINYIPKEELQKLVDEYGFK